MKQFKSLHVINTLKQPAWSSHREQNKLNDRNSLVLSWCWYKLEVCYIKETLCSFTVIFSRVFFIVQNNTSLTSSMKALVMWCLTIVRDIWHWSVYNPSFLLQVDVTGTLQFWDVTIDTASSILITLCVGLAVDYSAHVGHMFMTLLGNREGRFMYSDR